MMNFTGFADEASPDIEGQIEALKELGWTGIEIRMIGKTHFDDLDDKTFETIHEKLEAAGIRIACYGSQIANWSRPISTDFEKDVSELRRIIPRMKKTGTTLVRIMSYPNKNLSAPEWKREVLRRLRGLSRIAGEGGVILAHENCSGYGGQGWRENLELLEEINSPAFRQIFDTGNPVHQGQDAWQFYEAVREFIVHVHIKDYVPDAAAKDGYRACFPGEGRGEVKRVLSDLRQRGYAGWLSIEPHMVSVIHEGKSAGDRVSAASLFIEYGRRAERLLQGA